MNPVTLEEGQDIFKKIERNTVKSPKTEVIICPPAPYIGIFARKKSPKVTLGAQNVFHEDKGSYTGEFSAPMLQSLGLKYIIVGHSERRKMGEVDEIINKKVHAAMRAGVTPIICVGEVTRDDEGEYLQEVKKQLDKALMGVPKSDLDKLIIAYEPVFAVGAAQALDVHSIHVMNIFIKKSLVDIYRSKPISVRILYGGAVDPTNARGILTEGMADGFLIGRQSLDAKGFSEIISIAKSS